MKTEDRRCLFLLPSISRHLLTVFIFSGYVLLFGWLIVRVPFFRNSGFSWQLLLLVFAIRLLAAGSYGLFFAGLPDFPKNADTWRIFLVSVEEKKWLLRDPYGFFAELVAPRYSHDAGPLATHHSYLNDFKENLLVKISAIFNLFSGSRYYVNLVLFNFLTLFGGVALARVWKQVFPQAGQFLVLAATLLVPSVLFWCSGFHKEGFLLHAAGWIFWIAWQYFNDRKITLGRVAGLLFSLALLFFFRNFMVLVLLLALGAWGLAQQWPRRSSLLVPVFLLLLVAGFFTVGKIAPALQLPQGFAQRQQEFLQMKGQSVLPTPVLQPTPAGFWHNLPSAFNHAFLRPYLWEANKLTYIPAALEMAAWWLLVLMALYGMRRKQITGLHPKGRYAIMAALLFVLAGWLIIGYTIPFLAAVVRYKSIFWPFILPPVLLAVVSNYGVKKKEMIQKT